MNLDELKRLALEATPGPWSTKEYGPDHLEVLLPNGFSRIISDPTVVTDYDARYIAAANPAAVLALIERVEEAERRAGLRQQLLDAEKVERDALRERIQSAQREAYEALDAARAANEEAGRRSTQIESLAELVERAEAEAEKYKAGILVERGLSHEFKQRWGEEVEKRILLGARVSSLEALARKGLEVYHGRKVCRASVGTRPENPAECEYEACREWAAALEGK